ncbi:hypothetical protein TELCIR_20654, partial [Teladorsagia circumcincta]
MVRNAWLMGGIESGTKRVFPEVVENRDGPTFDAIMLRNVLAGTAIRTDCWRGYGYLANNGF